MPKCCERCIGIGNPPQDVVISVWDRIGSTSNLYFPFVQSSYLLSGRCRMGKT